MEKGLPDLFIVDDDLSFRKSLQRLLNSRGFLASSFESAWAFLDSVPPGQKGIAIVDINMPLLDGFSLMDEMRGMGYEMPVILITGHTGPDTRTRAMDQGAVGFLQKPFQERSLMALIEELEGDDLDL
ncbi:MAG: response regulator [Desulfobacter sp.]|nr:response regulator [Desulfobacter sp.]